jgi:hypothetical protein
MQGAPRLSQMTVSPTEQAWRYTLRARRAIRERSQQGTPPLAVHADHVVSRGTQRQGPAATT